MAITIGGVQLVSLNLAREKESGTTKLTGSYELVSSTGKILAKQSFNSYNEIALTLSGDSQKLMADMQTSIQNDLNKTLGLE